MGRSRTPRRQAAHPHGVGPAVPVFGAGEDSLLDILDHVLHKGVVLNGDLTIGLAQVELIYARLSVLLCAAERVLPRVPAATRGASPRARRGTPPPARRAAPPPARRAGPLSVTRIMPPATRRPVPPAPRRPPRGRRRG